MEKPMKIRLASGTDSESLLRIYAQYIDTAVTFEYDLPSAVEFARRIETIGKNYPYLVCELGGQIAGYAYAHRHMERAAYQWNAELSVYLDRAFTSRGLGQILYSILISLLKLQGVKTVYGGVTVPNIASEKLHESLGFTRLGTYHNAGYKIGKWHDVAWFEKAIAPYSPEPTPFLPIHNIPPEKIAWVMETANK